MWVQTENIAEVKKHETVEVLFFLIGLLYLKQGHVVEQLVEALRYKPEGCGFDSPWCHCNFSLTQSFRPHHGPVDDSASNRNEYQEYFLGGGGKGGRAGG